MYNLTAHMRALNLCILLFTIRCGYAPAGAQTTGRYEEAKRFGAAYIQSEQFDKAAGRLEEVWEQDESDPTVGENLAIAYLNSESRQTLAQFEKKAFALIEKLALSGASVSFLVQHSHEKLGWLQGRELNQYCRGRLSLQGETLTYVSARGDKAGQHSFKVTKEGLHDISWNEDDARGTFKMKVRLRDGTQTMFMATRNRNKNEAKFLVELIRKQMHSK